MGDDEILSFLLSRTTVEDDCWVWNGSRKQDYGYYDGKIAHRLVYKLIVGDIPEGLELDHLCRNRPCVNPGHLEPVTHAENVRRGAALRTHCKQGHEFTAENTYRMPRGPRVGARHCRACNRAAVARYSARATS